MKKTFCRAGINFYIANNKKVYIEGLKNVSVINEDSKTYKKAYQKAIKVLDTKTDEEIKQAYNRCLKRKRQTIFFDKVNPLFKKIFGFDIPVCPLSLMLGTKAIDAVRFDKKIKTPSGISTYAFVEKKYGNIGCRLLKKLI